MIIYKLKESGFFSQFSWKSILNGAVDPTSALDSSGLVTAGLKSMMDDPNNVVVSVGQMMSSAKKDTLIKVERLVSKCSKELDSLNTYVLGKGKDLVESTKVKLGNFVQDTHNYIMKSNDDAAKLYQGIYKRISNPNANALQNAAPAVESMSTLDMIYNIFLKPIVDTAKFIWSGITSFFEMLWALLDFKIGDIKLKTYILIFLIAAVVIYGVYIFVKYLIKKRKAKSVKESSINFFESNVTTYNKSFKDKSYKYTI